jgi:hypothetical protein
VYFPSLRRAGIDDESAHKRIDWFDATFLACRPILVT